MSSLAVRNASSLNKFILLAAVFVAGLMVTVQPMSAQADVADFDLTPSPKSVDCLGVPGGPTPTAHVTVFRGKLNDLLVIEAQNIKPNLAFDLFTVQHSPLLFDGTGDPAFKNFGLAWYQSDLQADSKGKIFATINTVLLDQIFGFDPDFLLPPTNTFHVGFWFNSPAAAKTCGFDTTHPTPFNGEHRAGPVAMISVPDAQTGLGPLCTNPDTSKHPAVCHP
jgi:hypothetical protein